MVKQLNAMKNNKVDPGPHYITTKFRLIWIHYGGDTTALKTRHNLARKTAILHERLYRITLPFLHGTMVSMGSKFLWLCN